MRLFTTIRLTESAAPRCCRTCGTGLRRASHSGQMTPGVLAARRVTVCGVAEGSEGTGAAVLWRSWSTERRVGVMAARWTA